MKINIETMFSSSDLALVTTLSLFYPINAIERKGTRATFFFVRDNGFDQILEAYWRRELKVEPQAFFQQLKIIKTRIYEI